jgi:hypothetical protein
MKCTNATNLHRKSGGAERRDLLFRGPLLEMCFDGPQLRKLQTRLALTLVASPTFSSIHIPM